MADFIFRLAPHILLGSHISSRLGQVASEFGTRFMVIADRRMQEFGYTEKLEETFVRQGLDTFIFDEIPSIPSTEVVGQALALARGSRVDGIAALGGVRTAAIGRAIASLYNEERPVYDFVDGKAAKMPPIPLIEIPTVCRDPFMFTEYTPIVDSRNRKINLLKILPGVCKAVVIDPIRLVNDSRNKFLATVLDALTVAVESFLSTKSTFFSDTILQKAIELLLKAFDAVLNPSAAASPYELAAQGGCMASIGAGTSACGTGTAIGLAVNARYQVSRSLVSTIMLPYIMEDAVRSRPAKLEVIAQLLGSIRSGMDTQAAASSAVDAIRDRLALANMPTRIKDLGLSIDQMVPATEDVAALEMMNYVPRAMTPDDLFDLIKQAY